MPDDEREYLDGDLIFRHKYSSLASANFRNIQKIVSAVDKRVSV